MLWLISDQPSSQCSGTTDNIKTTKILLLLNCVCLYWAETTKRCIAIQFECQLDISSGTMFVSLNLSYCALNDYISGYWKNFSTVFVNKSWFPQSLSENLQNLAFPGFYIQSLLVGHGLKLWIIFQLKKININVGNSQK